MLQFAGLVLLYMSLVAACISIDCPVANDSGTASIHMYTSPLSSDHGNFLAYVSFISIFYHLYSMPIQQDNTKKTLEGGDDGILDYVFMHATS